MKKEYVRIFLLRILIGWYMIPLFWIILLPFFYLLSGKWKRSIEDIYEATKGLWYGEK